MAEISKLKASQVKPIIVHNMRGIEGGKANGNESIDESKTPENYSLIKRGNSVDEINKYRKDLEKEVFHYKRKDIVHSIEYIFQLPRDCPKEQERAFFQACHDFVCQEILPMGEKCVFVSQVHVDEFYRDAAGNVVLDSDGNILSKKHLDLMAIPAVPDTKHEGYSWRLCADQLTRRQDLKTFHSKLQKYIDSYENEQFGITKENPLRATVASISSGGGKTIKLSVKQLKEITEKTGLTIDKTITLDNFVEILRENRDIKIYDKSIEKQLKTAEKRIADLSLELKEKLANAEKIIEEKDQQIITDRQRISALQKDLILQQKNNKENEVFYSEVDLLRKENTALKEQLAEQTKKIQELEKTINRSKEHTQEIPYSSWDSNNGWNKEREVERTW